MRYLAIDTETTGLDLHHGCRPFAVSAMDDSGNSWLWSWRVDPFTRQPKVSRRHRNEILQLTARYDRIVFHNTKFDVRALSTIGINLFPRSSWNFDDTALAAHALDSREDHRLKPLALKYIDILDDDEDELKVMTRKARAVGKARGWSLGTTLAGRPAPASDYWMVREAFPAESRFLDSYAIIDAERTIRLWLLFRDELKKQNLWSQYIANRDLLPHVYAMEDRGITLRPRVLSREIKKYKSRCGYHSKNLQSMAQKKRIPDLNPNSSKQLQRILYGDVQVSDGSPYIESVKNSFKLPVPRWTATGASTAASALRDLQEHCNKKNKLAAKTFLTDLLELRKCETALSYLTGYAQRLNGSAVLNPSYHQTGTSTTRFSSSSPNAQNVGKGDQWELDGEKKNDFKLRSVFGPPSGRVWYAMDYSQLQLRIFAHISGEEKLQRAFEMGYDFHQYVACKIFKVSPSAVTSQQRRIAKNVNFGIIFGAQESKIDETSGTTGMYKIFKAQFPNVDTYMRQTIKDSRRDTYVTTPGGYRLYLPWGTDSYSGRPKVSAYTGVVYKVQGSEGEIVKRAMLECCRYLQRNKSDVHLVLQVHDELVFDAPTGVDPRVINQLKLLMESAGSEYGMTTPVDVTKIVTSWDEGKSWRPKIKQPTCKKSLKHSA